MASLLVAVLYFIIFCGILHPGYAINDDLKMISILAGYPGNNPAPFLIFSNVLLGLILTPLYALHTNLNWEMLLFAAVNLLSVWALLYILLSEAIAEAYKVAGSIIILACTAYFALNITFTSTAALACFAGLCLLLAGSRASALRQKLLYFSGIALIFAGSLIRIEMLALDLPVFLPGAAFLYRSIRLRGLVIAAAIAGLAVFAGYAFDRLYVRAHPDWHQYYIYNKAAQALQDSNRLNNAGRQIRNVGWSSNDQEVFARYFFPDAGIYSLDRIRYLNEHIQGTSQNLAYTFSNFLGRLSNFRAILLLLAMASIWFLAQIGLSSRTTALALLTIAIIGLGENLGLVWLYKDPDYVLFSSLANTAVFEVLLLSWRNAANPRLSPGTGTSRLQRMVYVGLKLITTVVIGMALGQSIATSSSNLEKQTAYRQIQTDLERLQSEGKLAKDALIISPSHGLPWEWSNPFTLGFPEIKYLDTGWITFSPFYEQALQDFGIVSLPNALYQKDNVYLMTKSIFKVFLSRYYEEHGNIAVDYETIYQMPNTYNFAGYDGVELYKVILSK